MAVYFLDNDQQLIKIVPDNGAISILQTQELPEDNSLLKDVLSVRLKNDERLFDAQYMAIKSYDGNRNSFDMYRIVSESVPDNATEFEGVQVAPYELEGVVVEDLRPQGWTIERTTNQILKDSDWRLGYVDDNLPTVTTNFYYLSAKDSLKKLQELTGVEFTFKVEISGNKITDKWVEVYKELGNRTLKRFNYGMNALTVKRETNHSELYTALIGRGKGEEVGETEAGDATYGRKINFADVEWKKSDGKPVDKPKGQKYIELPQATAEFGVKMLDGRKVPRIGMVEFPDTEDPEILINQTWQALQEYARPKVLFSATVANIGDTGIGDTVTIHRHDLNMHYKTRVRKVMRNRKNNDKTQVEIGDVVYTASTKRQANINSQLDNMQNDLSNVKGEVSHVVTSADGKNNITYSNIEPERKKVGDSWVRDHPSLAGETQWLVWNGEAWELILDTSETTLNKEAIEQAQVDIAEAQTTANEAVEQIDTAVANAGFTSLDETIISVQTISNQAQINAGTAIDNALEAMQQASQAVDNTGSLNIRVDEVENTLIVKADKQTVDDLTGIVDSQALDIQANAQGLALKANQDTVDLIDGRVSSLGTEVSAVAGQISNKVWNTDIETAIDGIEVGGRNLLLNSNFKEPGNFNGWVSIYGNHELTDEGYLKEYTDSSGASRIEKRFYLEETGTFTFSIYAKTTGALTWRNHVGITDEGKHEVVIDDEFKVYRFVFENEEAGDKIIRGYQPFVPAGTQILIKWEKLEKGNKATDWTPALEDTDAKINHIETEWTQTFDTFSQTVASIDGRVSSQEQTVSGMQSVVYDPETGLSSLNTQLANLVQVAVTGEEMTGAISVLESNINARVEKGDVINQINISDESILLQANKIQALGDVVVDGKLTITDEFIAPNAQIDGAKIADATIGSAKIASLDVNKISGNSSEFVKSNWNTATGGNVNVTGSGILTTASNGSQIQIANGMVYVRNSLGNNLGQFGFVRDANSPATHYVRIRTSWGTNFAINQTYNAQSDRKDTLWMRINDSGQATMDLQSQIQMNYEGIYFADYTGQEGGSVRRVNDTLRIVGPQGGSGNSVAIYGGVGGSNIKIGYSLQSFSNGAISNHMWATLDMHNASIVNQSDERLKMNIVADEVDSLAAIKKWKLAGFDWRDSEATKERQFGVIAQSAPEIAFENYDGYLSINSTKQLQMATHAVQQLALREEDTNKVASQALINSKTNAEKIERLENEIQKLKEAA